MFHSNYRVLVLQSNIFTGILRVHDAILISWLQNHGDRVIAGMAGDNHLVLH
jgi:hypothetical protein